MKTVFIVEAKRVFLWVLLFCLAAIGLLFLYPSVDKVQGLVRDYKVVRTTIIGTYLFLTVLFTTDLVRKTRLLYLHSRTKKKELYLGKFLVTMFYATIVLLLMVVLFNIKAAIIQKEYPLEYFLMNFDDYGLLLVGRSFMEWLYGLNLLLNFGFYYFVVMAFFMFYEYLQQKKREKFVDLFLSGVVVFVPVSVLFVLAQGLTKILRFLNFNKLTPRVRAFELVGIEANFLSIPTLLLFGFGFGVLLYLVLKGWPKK